MQLTPLGIGKCILLSPSQATVVGRAHYSLDDTRISRQHAQVGPAAKEQDAVAITANKPVYVQNAQGGHIHPVLQGQSYQLHKDDIVYMLKVGESYSAGFKLQTSGANTKEPQRACRNAAAGEPAAKRPKLVAASTSATEADTGPTSPAACSQPGPFGAAIAAAAHATCSTNTGGLRMPACAQQHAAGSAGPATGQQLFSGVHLVDFDGHHTNLALTKAREEGATVSQLLNSTTTHVIARHELSAAELQRRLSAQASKQQRQQRHSTTLKRQSPQNKSLQGRQRQPPRLGEQLPLASSGSLTDSQHDMQQQEPAGGALAVSQLLPPDVQFVTVAWITQSLKTKQRLPEEQFHIDLQRQLQRSCSGTHAALQAARQEAAPEPAAAAAAGDKSPAAASYPPQLTAATGQEQQQHVQQVGQVQSPGRTPRHQQKQQVIVPGPDEICPAGEPWGSQQRWIEPWDDAAALDAMEQLMTAWHQTTGKRTKAHSATTATPGSTRSTASSSRSRSDDNSGQGQQHADQPLPFQQPLQQQQQQVAGCQAGDVGGECVSPCDHVACCKQAFCLVEEMERLKRNYHGRADQFRIKAASRTIMELERLQQPVIGPQDIDAMSIGEKSKQKLQEILQTGRLRRNDLLESSELHRTLQLFMTVWGCADTTARKWWAEGCRSLDDVRTKAAGLTVIQQMGLRYYEDFERRIPRAEVAEAVSIIRETTLDVLQGLTGKQREELDYQLHVRALGSFVMGKLDTGDIDMLLAPGPAPEDVAPGTLAAGLLQALQNKGYVPEGLSLDHRGHSLETAVRVSWMGVWKGPSSPCNRRLDIKTYQRVALPYAVNYFSSGQDCSRALRYWCNKPQPQVAALAAAVHPAANAFHLSDAGLYVVHNPKLPAAAPPTEQQPARPTSAGATAHETTAGSLKGSARSSGEQGEDAAIVAGIPVVTADGHSPTGPAGRIECTCETDLFRAVGLAYVPPHLRSWR